MLIITLYVSGLSMPINRLNELKKKHTFYLQEARFKSKDIDKLKVKE